MPKLPDHLPIICYDLVGDFFALSIEKGKGKRGFSLLTHDALCPADIVEKLENDF